MTWITQSRQRSVWLLVALVLTLSLAACGQQVNASVTKATNASNNNAASQQQQYQPVQPAQSQSGNTSNTTTTNLQSTDQQVQSIMNQLDGAHNDVNNSNAASSQDNGQQP